MHCVQAAWGTHELALAARTLLEAAFADPLNQRFIMLSESCIPLYPAATVYAQLMAEDKSRINSCGNGVRAPLLGLLGASVLGTLVRRL
jgi:Core-2/I-Branching enzyme